MYPLKLKSVLKDIIWGGTALSENFAKGTPGQKIAEAWVLTLREDGENIIENGKFEGKKLSEVIGGSTEFPLLIKLIDARDKLSVQVHPDDNYAKKEGLPAGKTEMWYILDAAPGAKLVYGMKKDTFLSDDMIRQAANNGTLEDHMNFVNVKKGDVFFIPAGLVHAIGEGILIAEVQQNSNTTYRMYDYNRKDKDGNTRELHLEKALEVINKDLPNSECGAQITEQGSFFTTKLLCKCDYFCTELLELHGGKHTLTSEKMVFALCLSGNGYFIHNGEKYNFTKGDSYLFPKEIGGFCAESDGCELLIATE